MNNYAGVKLRHDIINLLNSSGVEVIVGYYVVKDILHDLEDVLNEVVEQERNNPQIEHQEVSDEIHFNIQEEKENTDGQSISTNAPEYPGSTNDN